MTDAYKTDLFDEQGRRKYLNRDERRALLRTVQSADSTTRYFAQVLIYTGCRVSEALALRECDFVVDDGSPTIRFRTLKKKKGSKAVYRYVPIPPALAENLTTLFNIGQPRHNNGSKKKEGEPLWSWSRQTAWKKLKPLMLSAGIPEHLAQLKAIRHGFGIAAVLAKPPVPETELMRLMGHSSSSSSAIYREVAGIDSQSIAQPMWDDLEN